MKHGLKQWYAAAFAGEAVRPPPPYAWAIAAIPPEYKETGDPYDWVPIAALYAGYLAKWQETDWRDSRIRPLKLTEYAIAVRLNFMGGEPCRRMTAAGVRCSGIAGVTGPAAERSPESFDSCKRRKNYRGPEY